MMNELTYESVWKTLSNVNVDEMKAKKGKLDYLGWSKAWAIVMQHYPFASYEFKDETFLDNGTAMCHCYLRIGNLERYMWLSVMNYANESIKNPTYQQIQNTRMRCLVKAIAMFGLGFYIYEGEESFPYEDEDLPDQKKDQAEAEVVYEYTFKKTGGSIVGANTGEEYIDLIGPLLNMPTNVMHRKLYIENKDRINAAMASVSDDAVDDKDRSVKSRYEKLHELYSKKNEVKNDNT